MEFIYQPGVLSEGEFAHIKSLFLQVKTNPDVHYYDIYRAIAAYVKDDAEAGNADGASVIWLLGAADVNEGV